MFRESIKIKPELFNNIKINEERINKDIPSLETKLLLQEN